MLCAKKGCEILTLCYIGFAREDQYSVKKQEQSEITKAGVELHTLKSGLFSYLYSNKVGIIGGA